MQNSEDVPVIWKIHKSSKTLSFFQKVERWRWEHGKGGLLSPGKMLAVFIRRGNVGWVGIPPPSLGKGERVEGSCATDNKQ